MFEVLAESNPHKTSGAASEPQVSPQSPQSAKGQGGRLGVKDVARGELLVSFTGLAWQVPFQDGQFHGTNMRISNHGIMGSIANGIIEYMGMGWYRSLWNSLNEWSNSMTSHFCGSVGTPRTKDLTSRDVIFAWDKHTSV